jgi:acyl-CoA thioesterase
VHIDDILSEVALGQSPIVPANWAQGRTTYGGLTAAILLQAAMGGVDPERKLRTMDVNFTRPFEAESPYDIEVETLGEGKTLTVVQARLIQDGKLRAIIRADFCRPLDSDTTVNTFEVPAIRPQDESFPIQGPMVPTFFQHMEAFLASHVPPFGGKPFPEMNGWMRFKHAPSQVGIPHLVGLIDAWPPTAATYRDRPVPVSTISWHMHFTLDAHDFGPEDFLGYHSKVSFDEAGISSSTAYIWCPDGRLLAKSVQSNVIYG